MCMCAWSGRVVASEGSVRRVCAAASRRATASAAGAGGPGWWLCVPVVCCLVLEGWVGAGRERAAFEGSSLSRASEGGPRRHVPVPAYSAGAAAAGWGAQPGSPAWSKHRWGAWRVPERQGCFGAGPSPRPLLLPGRCCQVPHPAANSHTAPCPIHRAPRCPHGEMDRK